MEQALECISEALDGVDEASTADLRGTLSAAKPLGSRVELLETKAASLVARRERHGDSGAGLLNQLSGLSRAGAARKVRTDAQLAQMPAASTGVAAGEISFANASKLAQAARSAGHQAVQESSELMRLAKTLPDCLPMGRWGRDGPCRRLSEKVTAGCDTAYS
ncbi:hypothetical protein [Candidatus Poriferisodalis sp.]|uniref:hypothetical protein n=1 Tax=Candidatus Poriferisodalis sp. TaxID=3101277 RepID=UPI003B02C428